MQRSREERSHLLAETEITGREGGAKAFTGKVSEERWKQREHCVQRQKGTKDSHAFWALEPPGFPGTLGICREDPQTRLERWAKAR